jgi:phosphate-selective porin OprO/OprP
MKRALLLLVVAGFVFVSGFTWAATLEERVAALEEKAGSDSDFRAYWKDGLRLDSGDGAFKLQIGGRIYVDFAWMSSDDLAGFNDSVEFRTARFYTSGTIYDSFGFKLQVDLGGDKVTLKDAYVSFKDVPVVSNLKVGHFKEPFGLEELTSSKYVTFMERAIPNAFSPSRNAGVMVNSTALDKKMTWAAGVFRETSDGKDFESDDGYAVTGRITGTPWYEDEGKKVAHVGAAYSFRTNYKDMIKFEKGPEMNLAPKVVSTGDIDSDEQSRWGLEGAVVLGPLSFQGEYMHAAVDRNGGDDLDFGGYYLQASYFLTGECRPYDTKVATFSRVKPDKNFRDNGGAGAWEVAARYSNLNLSDDDIDGGELDNITVGVNWYMNPNMRVMLNYVAADVDNTTDGDADMAGVRFQVDF